jgi:hypothetical protein
VWCSSAHDVRISTVPMSKRRRVMGSESSESGSSESDSEEADEPYSMIWRAAGPLTMRHDMQHDSQNLHSLRTGDLVKQTKPAVTVRTTGRKYVHVSTVVAATGQEVVGWVTSLLGTEYPSGLEEIPEAEQEEAVGRYQAALSTPVSTTVAPASTTVPAETGTEQPPPAQPPVATSAAAKPPAPETAPVATGAGRVPGNGAGGSAAAPVATGGGSVPVSGAAGPVPAAERPAPETGTGPLPAETATGSATVATEPPPESAGVAEVVENVPRIVAPTAGVTGLTVGLMTSTHGLNLLPQDWVGKPNFFSAESEADSGLLRLLEPFCDEASCLFRHESFSFDAFQWSVGDGPLFVHKSPGPQWQSMTLWPEDLDALLGTSIDLVEDDDDDEESRDRRVAAKLLALQEPPRAASGVGAGGAANRAVRAARRKKATKAVAAQEEADRKRAAAAEDAADPDLQAALQQSLDEALPTTVRASDNGSVDDGSKDDDSVSATQTGAPSQFRSEAPEPRCVFVVSLQNRSSSCGGVAVPKWVANDKWTSQVDRDFMAVMAEHWDDTKHRGLSAELKKSLRPYKDNKQVLKAVLYANVPQAGGGMERQPVAGASSQLQGVSAYVALVSAWPQREGYGTELMRNLLRFLAYNGVQNSDLFADNDKESFKPEPFFAACGFVVQDDEALEKMEAKWLPTGQRHTSSVVPMRWEVTRESLLNLASGDDVRARARLLMCQLAVPVRNLYSQLDAQTKRLCSEKRLSFATLAKIDETMRNTGRVGLLHYLTTALSDLSWHPWRGWNATSSELGLGNRTANIVACMGCLLRVLPDLPTGLHDLAWDNDQQETPRCPTTVLGLAGKNGSTILKAAFVALFSPLLSASALDAVFDENSATKAAPLTTAKVQKLFDMVHRASHATYTAYLGQTRLDTDPAERENVNCVLYLLAAILNGKHVEKGTHSSPRGPRAHPFVANMRLQCFRTPSPKGHKLGHPTGEAHGLYSGLPHDHLFVGPNGTARQPRLARQTLQPWLSPADITELCVSDTAYSQAIPLLSGTAMLAQAKARSTCLWDPNRPANQPALRRASVGASAEAIDIRDSGLLHGVAAFDQALESDCSDTVMSPHSGEDAFRVAVVVHHCTTSPDELPHEIGQANCGCLSNKQLLLPAASRAPSHRPLDLEPGFEATCIIAREVVFPPDVVKRSQKTFKQKKAACMEDLATTHGMTSDAVAEYMVRDQLYVGEVVSVQASQGAVTLTFTEEQAHKLPRRWDQPSRSQADTADVPLDVHYTLARKAAGAAAFLDVLASSLVICGAVADRPLSTALRLSAPTSMTTAELQHLVDHSDQLLTTDVHEKAVSLKAGMACELNADPTGRFAIGAVAIFLTSYRAVDGNYVGVFFGQSTSGGTTGGTTGDTVPDLDGCPGVLVVPMSGPGALCILPLQESVSRYIHTSAYIEARNAAAQSLRALMLVQRNCFCLCRLLAGGQASEWRQMQWYLWRSLSPGPTPDESSNTSGSRHASSETVPSPRPAAGPAAGSGPGPGPGPGTSGSVVVPRSKDVKPLIDSITGHATKHGKHYWYWKWPPQVTTDNGVVAGFVLQDATYHGAVLNEGPAQRDLEGGGLRSKTQSVFVVTFKLEKISFWPNATVRGQQRPRWDVYGSVTVEPYLVQYDAGGSKSIKKDSNRRIVDVPMYECSKTNPEIIPQLDRILGHTRDHHGEAEVFKQFMAAVSDKVRGVLNRHRPANKGSAINRLKLYCQITNVRVDIRKQRSNFPNKKQRHNRPPLTTTDDDDDSGDDEDSGDEDSGDDEDSASSGSSVRIDTTTRASTGRKAPRITSAHKRNQRTGRAPGSAERTTRRERRTATVPKEPRAELRTLRASVETLRASLQAATNTRNSQKETLKATKDELRQEREKVAERDAKLKATKDELRQEREKVAERDAKLQAVGTKTGGYDETRRDPTVMVPWNDKNCATMLHSQATALLDANVDGQLVTNVLVAEARRVCQRNNPSKTASSFFEAVAVSTSESETREFMTQKMQEQFDRKAEDLDSTSYKHKAPNINVKVSVESMRALEAGESLIVKKRKRNEDDNGARLEDDGAGGVGRGA